MDCPNVSTKAEHWQRILDEQRLSKLSVVAFCPQKSISAPSFYQWRKKLQPPQASPTRQPLVPLGVIPVAPAVTEQFIQIMTPSGFSIHRNTAIDTNKLTQIIGAIEVTQRGESC